ncbi:MAG: hypothetical protein U0787_13625 [Polyangia bacterium]
MGDSDDGALCRRAKAETHRFIFRSRAQTVKLATTGKVRFVYANQDEIGFYRQRMTQETLAKLLPVAVSVLSPVELVGLLEDNWAMVRNGGISILASWRCCRRARRRAITTSCA